MTSRVEQLLLDQAKVLGAAVDEIWEENKRLRQALEWIEAEPEDPVKVQLWARAGLGKIETLTQKEYNER